MSQDEGKGIELPLPFSLCTDQIGLRIPPSFLLLPRSLKLRSDHETLPFDASHTSMNVPKTAIDPQKILLLTSVDRLLSFPDLSYAVIEKK